MCCAHLITNFMCLVINKNAYTIVSLIAQINTTTNILSGKNKIKHFGKKKKS